METLLSFDIENWVWNRQSACMAFMLSRSDMAPTLLFRADVERLARRATADFRRIIGEEYTMYNYHRAPVKNSIFGFDGFACFNASISKGVMANVRVPQALSG